MVQGCFDGRARALPGSCEVSLDGDGEAGAPRLGIATSATGVSVVAPPNTVMQKSHTAKQPIRVPAITSVCRMRE
jgi:hypothetical protein